MHDGTLIRVIVLIAAAMGLQNTITLLRRVFPYRGTNRTTDLFFSGIILNGAALLGLGVLAGLDLLVGIGGGVGIITEGLLVALSVVVVLANYLLTETTGQMLRSSGVPPGVTSYAILKRLDELKGLEEEEAVEEAIEDPGDVIEEGRQGEDDP